MIKFWVNIIEVYFCFLISLKYISLFGKKKKKHCMNVHPNFPIHPSHFSHLGFYVFSMSVSQYLFCK